MPTEVMITTTIIIINWKPIGVSNKFVLGKDTEKGRCRVFSEPEDWSSADRTKGTRVGTKQTRGP